jgi:hypothetical protein
MSSARFKARAGGVRAFLAFARELSAEDVKRASQSFKPYGISTN